MMCMKKIILFSFLLLAFACREKYVPQLNEPVTGYLVVEGFINSGASATTITLSRSTKLSNLASIVKETKAVVRVENKANTSSFPLTETSPGVYTNPQITLNPTDQYRLYIKSSLGKEYVSDYSAVRRTPDIDSVSWRRENGGVQIYANTHDNLANTKYYQFIYDETWEFTSKYSTMLKVYNDRLGNPHHVGYRDSSNPVYDAKVYRCWKTNVPSNILICSTEKLTKDIVSLFPLTYIDPATWKLGILYSINLKEYALSQQGYRFLEQLRKNTEQLGSIFDAQPSDNNGNMHCITNPDEVVIGFVEVSEEKQKRIFISNAQVPGWNYTQLCDNEIVVRNLPDSIKIANGIPTNVSFGGITGLDYIYFGPSVCVDCTLRGVNTKPPYWP
jgi:hypothetical protein